MLRKILMPGLFLLLISNYHISAQSSDQWRAVFYNSQTHTFLVVNGTENPDEVSIDESYTLYEHQMALLSSGAGVLFCHSILTSVFAETGLYHVDLVTGEVSELMSLGTYGNDCSITTEGINGTQVAVGLVGGWAGSGQEDWQLVIVDFESATVVDQLTSADIDFPVDSITSMPVAQYFDDDKLILKVMRWYTEGGALYPALQWNFADDTVEEVSHWGSSAWDRLDTTEEMVYLNLDDAYPVGQPDGMQVVFNTVVRRDAEGNEEIIWSDPEWIPTKVLYLSEDNVGVYLTLNVEADIPDAREHWIGITREGEVYDLKVGIAEEILVLPSRTLLYHVGALEEVQAEMIVPFWEAPAGEEYNWAFIGITEIEE